MSDYVNQLVQENQMYFKGKELYFENNASFKQCITNPSDSKAFITTQSVKIAPGSGSLSHQPELYMQAEVHDNSLFNVGEVDLVPYAVTEPKLQKDSSSNSMRDTTLISFWSRDSSGQF